jgi:hypothetical protein
MATLLRAAAYVAYSARPSQRAQVIGHSAKLPDDLSVAEIACSRVACAAKRYGADVALFARQRFSAHHGRVGVEAFCRLAGRHAVVTGYERQSDVVCDFGHLALLLLSDRRLTLKNACDDLLCSNASFLRRFGCNSGQIVVVR